MSSPSSEGSHAGAEEGGEPLDGAQSFPGGPAPGSAPASADAPLEGNPPLDDLDTSVFPAPPAFFHRYTDRNLALPPDALIDDVPGELRPFLRADLDPPNVDWIVEEGSYSVFGETWPIDEKVPTLQEMGVPEMFDPNADRKASLQSLLRTLIVSYTQLLDALLAPPPSLAHPQPPLPDGRPPPSDSERLTEHMRLIAINMHYLINELRPARETLKAMMRAQIELRKAKTVAIRQRCFEITTTLSSLHTDVLAAASPTAPASSASATLSAADETLEALEKLRIIVDAMVR
ncbi:hypothetical protein Rhopal_007053-T1 [Rhodotorula paludigena]|uniref:Mediator of RNA polymerase II transcription subunit 7 n=1 Tax=Rhodotorula paludigena TaxID=86838 RepID=A0AAV5GWY2_9BASI|nr:hypothetical protein Rhopal_007053-T1 [Rhodotorula paludigena]